MVDPFIDLVNTQGFIQHVSKKSAPTRAGRGGQRSATGGSAIKAKKPKQSTSADDIWNCKVCELEYSDPDDRLMECEYCDEKFCIQCIGITKDQYEIVSDPQFSWYCKDCKEKVSRCIKYEKEIEKRCEAYMAKLEEKYDARFNAIEGKVSAIEKQIKQPNTTQASAAKVDEVVEEKLQERDEELKQRELRKNNMIIFKLDEPDTNLKEERAKLDVEAIVKMCSEIGVDEFTKEDIITTTRLGKKSENVTPRPLLVKLKEAKVKKELFMRLQTLAEVDEYKDVSVNHDLTMKQRQEYKKLCQEASKKENDDNSGKWRYRVRGPPWAWHIKRIQIPEEESPEDA